MPYLSKLAVRLARCGPSYNVTAAVAFAVLVLGACASQDAGPLAPRQSDQIVLLKKTSSTPDLAAGLLRAHPLAADVVASASIGVLGGAVNVPGTGLTLVVPPGAVLVPTQFRVTALAGVGVAYNFEPHGTSFPVPVLFQQDLKDTNWDKVKDLSGLQVGYFSSQAQVDPSTGVAIIDEWQETTIYLSKHSITATLPHFSGYMVSSARSAPAAH